MIRYRSGMDERTGKVLSGWPHCAQSIRAIVRTMLDEAVMDLDFGSDLIRHIGRNAVSPVVVKVYRSAFVAIRTHEPEFRPSQAQLLYLDRIGGLALGLGGLYFPEGRLGNYAISEPKSAAFPLQAAEILGRAA